MSGNSSIEWTDATWNPVRGCVKISPGCKHCYAETFAERFRGVPDHPYEQGFDPRLVPEKLIEPLLWRTPKTVFVNSMSDLFQDAVSDHYIIAVARVMMAANWHTYQVLTKRSERMRDMLNDQLQFAAQSDHVWWGVSVEDRVYGIPRIADLQAAAARVRFVSIEPLLEELGELDLTGIHWAIVGGESGAGARPMDPSWVESVFAQCRKQNVSFFFKQWGGRQKSRTGRLLHERTYDELPLRPARQELPSRLSRTILIDQFGDLASSFTAKTESVSQGKTGIGAKKKILSKRRAGVRLTFPKTRASRA